MYKTFIFTTILLLISSLVYADNNSGFVESVGIVNKYRINIYKEPKTSSKVIRRFAKGAKVVVIDKVNDKWYKIKINNVRNGYVKTSDISFKNTLKKEAKRVSYQYKKVSLEIKSLIERFNINFSESVYFQQEGIVPQFEFLDMNYEDNTLNINIVYGVKTKFENEKTSEIRNPFANELIDFMEVILFKAMMYNAELYRINLYKYNYDKDKKTKVLYCSLEYKYDYEQFGLIKNRKGKIWNFVKTSKDLDGLFRFYP